MPSQQHQLLATYRFCNNSMFRLRPRHRRRRRHCSSTYALCHPHLAIYQIKKPEADINNQSQQRRRRLRRPKRRQQTAWKIRAKPATKAAATKAAAKNAAQQLAKKAAVPVCHGSSFSIRLRGRSFVLFCYHCHYHISNHCHSNEIASTAGSRHR